MLLRVLQDIDDTVLDLQDRSRSRIPLALCLAGVCLLAVHYLKFNTVCFSALDAVNSDWRPQLQASGWLSLIASAWWGLIHLVFFLLIPLTAVRWLLKDEWQHYHLGWGTVHRHWGWYLALVAPILIFIVLVTVLRDDFAQHYPFYEHADRSLFDLLAWECIYILQFIALEFFFRGFLLGACKRQLGSNAVFVMALPYLMLHFPKLWLEATGALLFGICLGILALRSRSIWGGVLVHVTIAVSMDIAALIKRGVLW